jgi:hypothetical protein
MFSVFMGKSYLMKPETVNDVVTKDECPPAITAEGHSSYKYLR